MNGLTKKDLLNYHISIDKNGNVFHCLPNKCYKLTRLRTKRYGEKSYYCYKFLHYDKTICLPEARLFYAFYVGDIEDNKVVVHIDGNIQNNKADNLKLVSVSELKKRS